MMDYKQPDFYHFTEDSILLTKFILEKSKYIKVNSILDLCAGSGVIGIELARSFNSIEKVTFVELQNEFSPYIDFNHNHFIPSISFTTFFGRFTDFKPNENFDLIVANPPYFERQKGRVSPNISKQICRTFMQNSITELCEYLSKLKTKDNKIYFLYPIGLENTERNIKLETKISDKVSVYSVIS